MLHCRVFFQLGSAASVKHLLLYAMFSPENGNFDISYPPLQRSIYHYHLVRSEYIAHSQPLPQSSNYFKVDAIFSPGANPHC